MKKRQFGGWENYRISSLFLFFFSLCVSIFGVITGKSGILDFFFAPIEGAIIAARTIFFLLIIGGSLNIFIASGIFERFFYLLFLRFRTRQKFFLFILVFLFSLSGTLIGISEEMIGFLPLIVRVCTIFSWAPVLILLLTLLPANIGVMASTLNPFVIQVALSLPGIKESSFLVVLFRWVVWFILTTLTAFFIWKLNCYRRDNSPESKELWSAKLPTLYQKIIMLLFFGLLLLVSIGLFPWPDKFIFPLPKFISRVMNPIGRWGVSDLSVLFLFFSVISWPLFLKQKPDGLFFKHYLEGMIGFLPVVVLIAVASGISFLSELSGLKSFLLRRLFILAKSLGAQEVFLFLLFPFFILTSILITSSVSFAFSVLPLLIPIGLQLGTLSTLVSSFSLCNGLVNLVSPTSPILMSLLAVTGFSYLKYIRITWKFLLLLLVLDYLFFLISFSLEFI